MQDRVVEDPVLGQRYVFSRVPAENGGDEVQVEMWVDPQGGVLIPHVHPLMEERFEVLEGTVTFLLGRRKLIAGPGEKAAAPAGVRHGYQNTGNDTAHVICRAQHPTDELLPQFLADAAALNANGAFTKHGIPKSAKSLLQGMVLLNHYREMVKFTQPPLAMPRFVVRALAAVGERRGYRAGHFAD